MTEEIKQMFAEHEPRGDMALAFDADDLVAGGRRRRRRRTVGVVTGVALTVAALTAGALALPQFVTDRSDATGEQRFEQPEYPFPELEPLEDGQEYEIRAKDEEGKPSEAADEYGEAFTEWFAEEQDLTFEDWPGMRLKESQIYLRENAGRDETPVGDTMPRYSIGPTGYDNGIPVPLEHRFADREVSDTLLLTVFSRGSFLDGTGKAVGYLADCEDATEPETIVDLTCTESKGPNGEKILTTDEVITSRDDDTVWQKSRSVVVYRTDGTAVTMYDGIPALHSDKSEADLDPGLDPYLSPDELIDLALSMPDTVVKR